MPERGLERRVAALEIAVECCRQELDAMRERHIQEVRVLTEWLRTVECELASAQASIERRERGRPFLKRLADLDFRLVSQDPRPSAF
jgi:hypothetical protein